MFSSITEASAAFSLRDSHIYICACVSVCVSLGKLQDKYQNLCSGKSSNQFCDTQIIQAFEEYFVSRAICQKYLTFSYVHVQMLLASFSAMIKTNKYRHARYLSFQL